MIHKSNNNNTFLRVTTSVVDWIPLNTLQQENVSIKFFCDDTERVTDLDHF